MSFGRKKRRAAATPPPPPVIPGIGPNGSFISGIEPYAGPPPMAQQNTWEGGNFVIPGRGLAMSTDILERFPQLAALFGGGKPQAGTDYREHMQNMQRADDLARNAIRSNMGAQQTPEANWLNQQTAGMSQAQIEALNRQFAAKQAADAQVTWGPGGYPAGTDLNKVFAEFPGGQQPSDPYAQLRKLTQLNGR